MLIVYRQNSRATRRVAPTYCYPDSKIKAPGFDFAEYLRRIIPLRIQEADESTLQSAEGMVDQNVSPGDVQPEHNHPGTARRYAHRLDIGQWGSTARQPIASFSGLGISYILVIT